MNESFEYLEGEAAITFLSDALKEANKCNEDLKQQLKAQSEEIATLTNKIQELSSKIDEIQDNVKRSTLL